MRRVTPPPGARGAAERTGPWVGEIMADHFRNALAPLALTVAVFGIGAAIAFW